MATIKHNRPTSLDVNYSGGKRNFLQLLPGVNINVDDSEWVVAKRHPSVKMALELGILDELFVEPSTADKDGLQVSLKDDPLSGQPLPVQQPKLNVAPVLKSTNWKPSQPELVALEGIGNVAAKLILKKMPDSGFSSLDEFKSLNEGVKFSESEIEAKFN
ncbi:MAG: hypothetical protein KME47_09410 [Nodosilinea sp. WJT8-NPBG4]|jgi:hypothetical protein|nr:hypothetical protein [Nodosilinea sp. WJT8-NPBG4]